MPNGSDIRLKIKAQNQPLPNFAENTGWYPVHRIFSIRSRNWQKTMAWM